MSVSPMSYPQDTFPKGKDAAPRLRQISNKDKMPMASLESLNTVQHHKSRQTSAASTSQPQDTSPNSKDAVPQLRQISNQEKLPTTSLESLNIAQRPRSRQTSAASTVSSNLPYLRYWGTQENLVPDGSLSPKNAAENKDPFRDFKPGSMPYRMLEYIITGSVSNPATTSDEVRQEARDASPELKQKRQLNPLSTTPSQSVKPKHTESNTHDAKKQQATAAPESKSKAKSSSFEMRSEIEGKELKAFQKLVDNFKSASKPALPLKARSERWSLDDVDSSFVHDQDGPIIVPTPGHRKASSWSSNGFAATVKDARTSNGPASIGHQSEKSSKLRFLRRSRRSSRQSEVGGRASLEEHVNPTHPYDEAARQRGLQRRRVLDELIGSEEGYINDLKVLSHVYVAVLASMPEFPRNMQADVARNLNEILLLHEEILIHIKLFGCEGRPMSPLREDKSSRAETNLVWSHRRDHTFVADPQDAANVAKVFQNMMSRFFVYEEYGARYEQMLHLVALTSRSIPNWSAFERGIESLMHSLLPKDLVEEGKKGLSLEDLLIKPIQRVCRYPLIFAELLKNTPACDDEKAEATISLTLSRLRETTQEINMATNDVAARAKIQRSWRLQDLLFFLNSPVSHSALRTLGHVRLCGILFVAYQSENGIQGEYMLCALFGGHFLLASKEDGFKRFKVVAITSTADFGLEKIDDGTGLQCNNALFSWKLTFVLNQHMYEVILCACSAREEEQWRTELMQTSKGSKIGPAATDVTFLGLDIKPFAFVFGQPGTLSRQVAMQRAASVDRRPTGSQVIIQNTHSSKEGGEPGKNQAAAFNRSQSLNSGGRIQILAPERGERIRMENALESVWTKDQLPFPGMAIAGRGANLIHTSKNSVLRKLSSKASNTSYSSKRSISYSSIIDQLIDGASQAVSGEPDRIATGSGPTDGEKKDYTGLQGNGDGLELLAGNEVSEEEAPKHISFGVARQPTLSESTAVPDDDGGSSIQMPSKSKKTRKLLKAFSTEGIRTWFTG